MSTDKKQCPYCRRGKQTSTYAPRPYPCEDCGGTGELYFCESCQEWLDPGLFNDPDIALCMRCEDKENHLQYRSESMGIYRGDIMVASTFMVGDFSEYQQACGLAAKIAQLLNQEEQDQ